MSSRFPAGKSVRRSHRNLKIPLCAVSVASLCVLPLLAEEEITFSVTFDDPGEAFTDDYADIERLTLAAANDWARYLAVPDGVSPSIEIQIDFLEEIGDAAATSDSIIGLREEGDLIVYRQGVAHEILTGEDINDDEPDALISLNAFSLENWFWYDPDPTTRTTPIPGIIDTDFYSLMLHELGHVLGFNGNLDETGTPFFEWISDYDALVTVDEDGRLFFNGPAAQSRYGGPVPLTPGDYKHVGSRSDAGLEQDLMHTPANCTIGGRCHISRLDLAILKDTGLPVRNIPEKPTLSIGKQIDGSLFLEWSDAFGLVQVQASETLEPGNWSDLTRPLDGWRWTLEVPLNPTIQFFQIVVGE